MIITKKALREIKAKKENNFEKWVLNDILKEDADRIEGYVYDVRQHGCISGIVTSLIYYTDTNKIFKKYYAEILEIIENDKLYINFDKIEINPNNLTWLAYEIVINNICSWFE